MDLVAFALTFATLVAAQNKTEQQQQDETQGENEQTSTSTTKGQCHDNNNNKNNNLSRANADTVTSFTLSALKYLQDNNNSNNKRKQQTTANQIIDYDNKNNFVEQRDGDGFVPSQLITQLFPGVSQTEASLLLKEAGLFSADDYVTEIDDASQDAIQNVIEYLEKSQTDQEELDTIIAILNNENAPDNPFLSSNNDIVVCSEIENAFDSSDNSTTSNKAMLECPCCYEEVELSDAISCKESGHLYCRECVRRHAEALIFGAAGLGKNRQTGEANTELQCIDENCCSGFEFLSLELALPYKMLERYGEIQGQIMLEKVNLDGLCTCPKCGFQALLAEDERIFPCKNDDCQFRSCRECGKPPHGDVPCLQAELEGEKDEVRHSMEEAMTAALLRICPNPSCKRALVKDGGCNKVTCSCGWHICNVCREKVDGYDHFCNAFSCSHHLCGKCALYKDTTKDDKKAIEDAEREGKKEMNKIINQHKERDDAQEEKKKKKKRGSFLMKFFGKKSHLEA